MPGTRDLGWPGCALDKVEETTADAERRRDEKRTDQDHCGESDNAPGRERPRAALISGSGAIEYVIPVCIDNRKGVDPFERIRDFQLNVCHRTASSYERRSAECAVASVAETVPTSTSRAVAIDR